MTAWGEVATRLGACARWLAQGESAALLVVTTETTWRSAVLETMAIVEHEDDTLRPFVWLEVSWSGDGGWRDRLVELREELQRGTRALEEGGLRIHVARVSARPPTDGEPGSLDAARDLADALRAGTRSLPPELDGLVVVVAPPRPDLMGPAWVDVFTALMREPSLEQVRWAVVSTCPQPALDVLVTSLSSRARVIAAVPRPEAVRALGRDVLRGMIDGRSGAGLQGARAPACAEWNEPDVGAWRSNPTPTTVVASPTPTTPDAATAHPEDPLDADDAEWMRDPPARGDVQGPTLFDRLRVLVASAALALSEGRGADAARHERDARDLCFSHSRIEDGIRLELMLASTLVGTGKLDEAEEVASWGATHAVEAELPALATQGCLVLGMVRSARGADAAAIEAFRDGGEMAERAGLALLGLEAWRMAGDAAARAGHEPAATEAWKHALRLAGEEPDVAVGLEASTLAERLADVCARHGLHGHAASFRAQATRLGAGAHDAVANAAAVEVRASGKPARQLDESLATPGPTTPAFPEVPVADVPRNRVAPELKGTVRLDDEPANVPDEEG